MCGRQADVRTTRLGVREQVGQRRNLARRLRRQRWRRGWMSSGIRPSLGGRRGQTLLMLTDWEYVSVWLFSSREWEEKGDKREESDGR
jgi:hypothetical protein